MEPNITVSKPIGKRLDILPVTTWTDPGHSRLAVDTKCKPERDFGIRVRTYVHIESNR